MKKMLVLHPFLFALFPVLFLFAQNAGEARVTDLLVPMIVVLSAATLLQLLLKLVLRNAARAALMATFFFILFFSYSHLLNFIIALGEIIPYCEKSPNRVLLNSMGVALLIAFICLCWTKRSFPKLTVILNGVGVILVLIQIVVGGYVLTTRTSITSDTNRSIPVVGEITERPDIYYIILDGYARRDILLELFDYDNAEFLDSLRGLGFTISDSSYTNYCQSLLSLSSTLNLDYLDQIGDFNVNSSDRVPLTDLIETNIVFDFLRQEGYRIETFATGYDFTELDNVDIFWKRPHDISEFANMLISTTPLPVFLKEVTSPFILHRERVRFTFDQLSRMGPGTGPRLVFAHIISPHPPFLYDETGAEHQRSFKFSFADGDHYTGNGGTTEEYIAGYRTQVRLVSQNILAAVNSILTRYGEKPPIIIIQADHGPGSRLHWKNMEKSDVRERLAILNAYFLPGLDSLQIYPDITPVNTFRIVLNQYFGGQYELLPDRSYFSTWPRPFDFHDVTERVRAGELRGESETLTDSIAGE